jgi:hypothetical protein
MQAIITKYIGPSNVKGSRVKASCQAGSVTLHWDDALNVFGNNAAAANAIVKKFGWQGDWTGGYLPDGSMVWVCNDSPDRISI